MAADEASTAGHADPLARDEGSGRHACFGGTWEGRDRRFCSEIVRMQSTRSALAMARRGMAYTRALGPTERGGYIQAQGYTKGPSKGGRRVFCPCVCSFTSPQTCSVHVFRTPCTRLGLLGRTGGCKSGRALKATREGALTAAAEWVEELRAREPKNGCAFGQVRIVPRPSPNGTKSG